MIRTRVLIAVQILGLITLGLLSAAPAWADTTTLDLIWQYGQQGDTQGGGGFVNSSGQVAFERQNVTFYLGTTADRIWVTPPADTGSVTPRLVLEAVHIIPPPWEPYLTARLEGLDDAGILTLTVFALTQLVPLTTNADCTVFTCTYSEQTLLLDTQLGTGHATANYGVLTTGIDQTARLYRIDPPAAVPEPATWLLLGSGLIGLAAWRRKKAA